MKPNGVGDYFFEGIPDVPGKRRYYFAIVEIKKDTSNKTVYVLNSDFKKIILTHPNYPNMAFVEYVGDHALPIEAPHGNARFEPKKTRPFVSTAPSVIKAAADSSDSASLTYRKLRNNGPTELERHLIEAPRDTEQIQNAQKRARSKLRISRDEIYNTIVFATEKQMITSLSIIPSLIVFGFAQDTLAVLHP